MLQEFKAFIARGNVLDLAVAVIIGAAFGAIVTSLTGDVIMPLIGAVFGGADFSNHFILLSVPAGYDGSLSDYAALKAGGAAMIGYGAFLTALLNFLILALVIFLLVRAANRMIAKKQEAPAGPSEIDLLTEIRDELRQAGSSQ
jgi:large conductance mechanosensitive channel